MSLNILCAIAFFVLQIAVNFFLAPFILEHLGEQAYGFLVLCNSVVSWGYVLSSLINSLCGRFVAFHYHKNEIGRANEFYSSALVANAVFCAFLCAFALFVIVFIKELFGVGDELVFDVRFAFGLYALNFILGLFIAVFGIHAFILNKMYLISLRQAISALGFAVFICIFYIFFTPMIAYAALSALLASILVLLSSFVMIKKLKSGICFMLGAFRLSALKTLASSGALNSVQSVSYMLLTSADLLIVNFFLGASMLGVLALAKAVVMFMTSFVASAGNSFMSVIVSFIAKDDIKGLCVYLRFAIRLLAFITLAPMLVFIAVAPEFYSLWLGFRDKGEIELIAHLAMIAGIPALLSACMYPLLDLNIATNKQKRATIAMLVLALSTAGTQAVLLYFGFGLWAVLIAASALYCAKTMFFDVINAALLLDLKPFYFMKEFLKTAFFAGFCFVLIFLAKGFLLWNSWALLFFWAGVLGIFAYLLAFLILFDKEQKIMFKNKVLGYFKK